MSFMTWINDRLPLDKVTREHLTEYYAPKNFNFWYFFGSLALLVLVLQIVTGVLLAMNYKPDAELAFASVEYSCGMYGADGLCATCIQPALRCFSWWFIYICSVV